MEKLSHLESYFDKMIVYVLALWAKKFLSILDPYKNVVKFLWV